MKEKWYYCEKYNAKLKAVLEVNNIKYKEVGDDRIVPKMISFQVDKDFVLSKKINKYTHTKPIITFEYSKEEINEAQYLIIVPTKNVVNITNELEAFVYNCEQKSFLGEKRYNHKKQISTLNIDDKNIDNTTTFYFSATGNSELFVKNSFKDLVKNSDISGLVFMDVNNCNGTNKCSLCQITASNIISSNKMKFEHSVKIKKCVACGKMKVVNKQTFQLRIEASEKEFMDDFYMTDAIFGEGISYPLFIMSNKLYKLLCDNNMTKNVKFIPVVLEMNAALSV